ncbi:MAG: transaldolase family protein, partial [Sphaerochaetaceae bacterium]|nr:transaldolase family protein [Sphaerochaetaceae bacterium]
MELFLDSANVEVIKKIVDFCPLKGVTTNPSIISRQENYVFFNLLEEIQKTIGSQRVLMVQVIASTYEGMIKDAQRIVKELGKEVFIKVPATLTGIKVIKTLSSEYYNVTSTAVYSTFQGIVSLNAGAQYIAVYYNRIENLGLSAEEVISSISKISDNKSKIIGASFKNINQVTKAY